MGSGESECFKWQCTGLNVTRAIYLPKKEDAHIREAHQNLHMSNRAKLILRANSAMILIEFRCDEKLL